MEEIVININGGIMISGDMSVKDIMYLKKVMIMTKTQNFYILLVSLLITIALFIANSIYCYLIKHRAKQKNLLPLHDTNNELKNKFYIDNINQKSVTKSKI